MVKAEIVNVVATASLNQKLDLSELGESKDFIHDAAIYRGLVAYFKTSSMKGKVSIFASGKMISVGTTSEKGAFHELEYAMKVLAERGYIKPIQLAPKVENIVVKATFGKRINLEELARTKKMIYEPEQFPGGILRIKEPTTASVLLFASGKAVVVGLKNSRQVKDVLNHIRTMIGENTTNRQNLNSKDTVKVDRGD